MLPRSAELNLLFLSHKELCNFQWELPTGVEKQGKEEGGRAEKESDAQKSLLDVSANPALAHG